MTQALIQAKIDAAREAIVDAEGNLQKVLADIADAAGADNAMVSEVVHAATSTLQAAKATLAELEKSMARAKLVAARATLGEAEKYLDTVLSELVVVEGADTTWVGKVVRDAFTKVRLATAALADLETIVTDAD